MAETIEQAAQRVLEMTTIEAPPSLRGPSPVTPEPAVLDRANLLAILQLAVQVHRQGHLRDAKPIYERILAADPDQADALHLLGVLHHQLHEAVPALELLQRAIALRPDDADCLRHLGEVHRAGRHFDEAVACFKRALTLDPTDADSMCNLGHTFLQSGRFQDAEMSYRAAIDRNERDDESLTCLGIALGRQERREEAVQCYEAALAVNPENEEARHMLAGMTGNGVSSAPARYVADLFDQYADTFDEHLVKSLQYKAPELIRDAVAAAAGVQHASWRIVDLGCGTGLCGEQLRPFTSHLVGVDISSRMIELAGERNLYDRLLVGDVMEAFQGEEASVDLVVAADVFVYIGDLDHVFAACRRALRDGGLLAFTTERSAHAGFRLEPSGRFSHSETYVRSLAAAHGMDVESSARMALRLDQGVPIEGQLFLLRARSSGAPRD